jgi:LPXTG-site transpeptidase (sortase) family protein
MTFRLHHRWPESGLLVLGLVLLALWSWNVFDSRRFQRVESKAFDATLVQAASDRDRISAGAIAFVGPPNPGLASRARMTLFQHGVLGRIEIPRLGMAAMVAEGVDARTLRHAVGHVPSTALPGWPGNCALAGHRDTFLRGLGRVHPDDVIRLVTLDRTYTYRVEWGVVVDPHRVEVLDSTAVPSLTLVTCYPFEYVGHAPRRFVVRAQQVEAGTPPRRSGSSSSSTSQTVTAFQRKRVHHEQNP